MPTGLRELRVGVVGCGAVAELCHVPALARLLPPDRVWLADTNIARARRLAELIGSTHVVSEPGQLVGNVDAAVVAVPNDLHAPVAVELLEHGIHVPCEKPLAPSLAQGEAIVAAARAAILRVGHVRRFFPSTRFVEHVLRAEVYGRAVRFRAEEGVPFDWPASSGFLLDRRRAGGGVLIDSGAHTLDQLLLWFGPDLEVRSYRDDASGGVEAECLLELGAGDVSGVVEMSRTRRLTNSIVIECERGTISAPLSELAETLRIDAGYQLDVRVPDESANAYEAQLRDFLNEVAGGPGGAASGEDAMRVLRLVGDCYRQREPLAQPWVTRTIRPARGGGADLASRYRRILVTGASGFLGCRLTEHLRLSHEATTRAMFHRPERALRLARLDAELVQADLADRDSLARAVADCDAVVHCAIGTDDRPAEYRFLTGRAAGAIAEAALDAGVRRFVHISSVAVHGYAPQEKLIDETSPVRFTGDDYADGKVEAEQAVAAVAARGLPVVVLRPANIFGPYSTTFTIEPVMTLREGRIALVDDGACLANTIYVDNVVQAIVLALTSDRAVGEHFVLSDEDGTTWRRLFEEYAALVGPDCAVRSAPMDVLYPPPPAAPAPTLPDVERPATAREIARRVAVEQPLARALGRTLLSPFPQAKDRLFELLTPPPPPPADHVPASAVEPVAVAGAPPLGWAQTLSSGVRYSAEKARSVLGYEPVVLFDEGIALTAEWLRFARLLGPR